MCVVRVTSLICSLSSFKTYKPVLSRVFHSYQKFIEFAQVSLRRVSELEFQMYTMQERTQVSRIVLFRIS